MVACSRMLAIAVTRCSHQSGYHFEEATQYAKLLNMEYARMR